MGCFRDGYKSVEKTESRKKADMFSCIAHEFARCFSDLCYLTTFLKTADKLAWFFAVLMIVGVFMPWISSAGFFTETGLMGGGDLHLLLAIMTFWQIRKVATYQIKAMRKKRLFPLVALRLRRIALTYVLIGIVSTLSAIIILLYFGSQYATISGIIDVRIGFYVTISAGLGIFGCGLERFRR